MAQILEYFKGNKLAAQSWGKYSWEGERTPDDMFRMMAREFFNIENSYKVDNLLIKANLSNYGRDRKQLTEEDIYELFKGFRYLIPGGSVMAGLGSPEIVSLSNCFVAGSPKDDYLDIMDIRSNQVQLMKRRGGVGYDLSNLRPRGAKVSNAAKTATGPASFMNVSSEITKEVAQEGRRGALMLSLSINHPDVEEFIMKKQDLTKVTGANISVKVTDEFMQAVENDKDYILRFPTDLNFKISDDLGFFKDLDYTNIDVQKGYVQYKDLEYNKLYHFIKGIHKNPIYIKRIKAKELWDKLIYCAWNTAEPGIMFEDRMINYSPDGVYPHYRMISSNPCSEIGMGANDSCRLMHLNLSSYVNNYFTKEAELNEYLLYRHAYEAMRLADDLVDLEVKAIDRILKKINPHYSVDSHLEEFEFEYYNSEFQLWLQIRENAIKGRRTGLGFTGLGDVFAMLNIKYGSKESLELTEKIMKTIFEAQLNSSIDLAIERGPFLSWSRQTEETHKNEWYSFLQKDFLDLYNRMNHFGRRNISWSTVAPTGTVSILAGCTSGIEPLYSPFYERRKKCTSPEDRVDYVDVDGEKFTKYIVIHPNFAKWLCERSFNGNYQSLEFKRALSDFSYLNMAYKRSPYYNSIASDINWKDRIKLQGIIQKYTTHSISSTINLPNETTQEEIYDIYMEAWKQGNKGQTIYRDGSRQGVINKIEKPVNIENRQAPKRPKDLEADYYQVKVKGEQFIVLVGLLENKPYEIFAFRPLNKVNIPHHKGIITKRKKMHYTFNSEYIEVSDLQLANSNIEEKAATLYSSMLLRHGADIEFIVKTAKKVNDNISSFSSAMCRILSKYTKATEVKGEECPECKGRLIREGGCIHCLDCSYSKCM